MSRNLLLSSFGVILAGLAGQLQAGASYSFTNATNKNAANVATGINQLSLTVTQLNNSQVALLVQNTGAVQSNITGVYIQGLKSVGSVDAGGRRYTVTTRVRSLPGVRATTFKPDVAIKTALRVSTTTALAAKANVAKTGQTVKIIVNATYDDIVHRLAGNSLRVGVLMQGFNKPGSETFIDKDGFNGGGGPQTPAPGAILLGAIGTVAVGWFRGRKLLA